jgi:hypothetical protein
MARPGYALLSVGLLLLGARAGAAPGLNLFPLPASEGTGERELKALASAYPDRISQVAPRDGDWAVEVDGEWFFWAHGRILPQSQRMNWERYVRFRFYHYTLGVLPPLPHLDAEAAVRLKKALEEARLHPPRRSEAFLERLFGAGSWKESASRIVTLDFLGYPVKVHQRIAEALRSVASDCNALRRTDPQAARFLGGLSKIDGFNYREVAGTLTRSYHSYGLAVDLIPKSYGGKDPYWRWAMDRTDQWWATPYERRWMVPASIVAAFEKQGFVWGGKWMFFDTMHFEYRPEIFVLAREEGAP